MCSAKLTFAMKQIYRGFHNHEGAGGGFFHQQIVGFCLETEDQMKRSDREDQLPVPDGRNRKVVNHHPRKKQASVFTPSI